MIYTVTYIIYTVTYIIYSYLYDIYTFTYMIKVNKLLYYKYNTYKYFIISVKKYDDFYLIIYTYLDNILRNDSHLQMVTVI